LIPVSESLRKRTQEEIAAGVLNLESLQSLPRHPISVICENIRSLYNVGSIFRTADALRLEKIYLCGYTGHPPRKEIDKVALGAVDSVPWEYRPEATEVIRVLRAQGTEVLALEHTTHSRSIQEYPYQFPVAMVLGHECDGITTDLVSLCDGAIEIPMHGIKQSLNVATAFGVAGYEILRHYQVAQQGSNSVNSEG
jgi:tRNA G18 (ribose-2'-O)-methylase SpoU